MQHVHDEALMGYVNPVLSNDFKINLISLQQKLFSEVLAPPLHHHQQIILPGNLKSVSATRAAWLKSFRTKRMLSTHKIFHFQYKEANNFH